MLNFRFVKSQYKRILIPLIVLAVLTLLMLIPPFTQKYMGGYNNISWDPGGWITYMEPHNGAMEFLRFIYFGVPGIVLMFIFSTILTHMLISKEIKEGYMASWLTSSMSRRTIINSKLFVLLSGMLGILFVSMILQSIIFSINLQDFSSEVFGKIILMNINFMFIVVLFVSINWMITNFFSKSGYSIAIISGILAFFVIMTVTTLIYRELSVTGQFKYLKFTQYLTITSLFNFPFTFNWKEWITTDTIQYVPMIHGVKTLDFAWQMPLMATILPGLFILGNQFLIKKDLHL